MAAGCGKFDVECNAQAFLASTIGDALTKTADAVLAAVGKAIASLGTMWVNIGTPTLTGGGGSSGVAPGSHAGETGGIETVLGYATYLAFGIAVLALIVTGARMGLRRGHEAGQHVDRLGVVLVATIVISAAAGLVTAVFSAQPSQGSPAVAFLQDSLWWYVAAVAMLGVIVGGARMAWEQRADAGKDVVKGLMTLVVVSGAGLVVVQLLVAAGDAFSVWLLDGSLGCSIETTKGTCFGASMAAVLALTSGTTGGLGAILIIVLGMLAIFGAVFQILFMVVRSGMLVVLSGVLPASAAATNTELGRQMFRKTTGWLGAFILYKPAAAIVYAGAFKLTGTSLFRDDGSGLISVIVGLTLMGLALVALPALMKLIVPAVAAVSSGAGVGAAAAAGAAMLPTGAMSVGRLFAGGSGEGSAGPTGAAGAGGPTGGGSPGPGGPAGPAGPSGGGPASGAGAGASGAGAGASGAGAGAAAAAGPTGAAAGVGVQAFAGGVRAVSGAVEAATSSAGGPDGSR